MARGKRQVTEDEALVLLDVPVLENRLIRALVAELPEPSKEGFQNRESWFAMARNAFDVVYGSAESRSTAYPPEAMAAAQRRLAGPLTLAAERLHVAPDGSVMCGARWVRFGDVPPGSVIHDERTEPERGYDSGSDPTLGRTDNLLWADVGTRPDGKLPTGARLVNATGKQDAA